MNKNRIRGIAWGGALLIIILGAMGFYAYRCLHPSRKTVQAAKARIEAYSCYQIRRGDKLLLQFDEDTTTLAATFANRWALVPSCQGRLIAAYNPTLMRNLYKGIDPDSVLQEKVDSIDSLYRDSKWKEGELAYYIHSHSVMDLGYNRICAYENREKILRDSAKKLLDSLHHIQGFLPEGIDIKDQAKAEGKAEDKAKAEGKAGDKAKAEGKAGDKAKAASKQKAEAEGSLRLVHVVTYRAFYTNSLGKTESQPCHLLQPLDGEDTQGCHLFQLESQTTPKGIFGLAPRSAAGLAKTHATTLHRPIDYAHLIIDSLGSYSGSTDSTHQAHGYGIWTGNDGTYYEGEWDQGKRQGWGFSIGPKKPLRVGEWKNDRYKGERLVYTSHRIYGIDISKYQHIRGNKKCGINWQRLRITHLGSISKKTVAGSVDFPIRFIYIKSTEGKSMVNPYYKQDYSQARAHGYKVGTYHFFSTISPAALQANHFIRHSNLRKGDFPPVLDLEPMPSQIKKMGGTGVLFARVRTWLRLVERATGVKPILYISQTFVNRYLPAAPDIKRNYPVWIARYGEYKPDIHLVYWQLCPDGRVAGIQGHVDINVFNGYLEAYAKYAKNEVIK